MRSQTLEEKASKAPELSLKANEFISRIVTDLSFPTLCEDNIPLPSLKNVE